jgi:exopolysaccharide production protein ExoQ
MGAPLAILICSIGIAGLFYLNRDDSIRTSKALWLPVLWLGIVGSRPVSLWLGTGGPSYGLSGTLDGSPTDAAFYAVLLVIGLVVLLVRRKQASAFVAVSGPLVIYLLYCLISVSWSPFHGPAFKRWTKDLGDLVMVLIIMTDPSPIAALRRIYSRLGFVLLPLSIALIRYTDLGRGYDPDGNPMNTGVTTNKNTLGLTVFLLALGTLWNLRFLLNRKDEPNRGRRLLAQWTLFAFCLALLQMAHSATSIACFILGAVLMLTTGLRSVRTHPARVNALCLTIMLLAGITFLSGGDAYVVQALGRKPDLSGRKEIWSASLASAENPWIGTGYESFWNANAPKVNRILRDAGYIDMSNLVSAHNGYLEVYLDLGLIGLFLIAVILINGYRHACRAFLLDPELGGLFLAYVATVTIYGITEVSFRVLGASWLFLLLAVVGASGTSAGLLVDTSGSALPSEGMSSAQADRNNKLPLRGRGIPRVGRASGFSRLANN